MQFSNIAIPWLQHQALPSPICIWSSHQRLYTNSSWSIPVTTHLERHTSCPRGGTQEQAHEASWTLERTHKTTPPSQGRPSRAHTEPNWQPPNQMGQDWPALLSEFINMTSMLYEWMAWAEWPFATGKFLRQYLPVHKLLLRLTIVNDLSFTAKHTQSACSTPLSNAATTSKTCQREPTAEPDPTNKTITPSHQEQPTPETRTPTPTVVQPPNQSTLPTFMHNSSYPHKPWAPTWKKPLFALWWLMDFNSPGLNET